MTTKPVFVPRQGKPVSLCQWFVMCQRPATTTVDHPILGDVPCCAQCAEFARPSGPACQTSTHQED